MAGENVIRKDVVQIGFDIDGSPITSLQKMVDSVQSIASGMADSVDDATKEFKDMGKQVDDVTSSAKELGKTNVDGLSDSVDEATESAKECETSLSAMAKSLGGNIVGKFKELPNVIESSATAARNFGAMLKAVAFDNPIKGAKKLFNGVKSVASGIKTVANMNVSTVFLNGVKGATKLGKSIVSNVDKSLGKAIKTAMQLPSVLKSAGSSVKSGLGNAVSGAKSKFLELVEEAKKIGPETKKSTDEASSGFTILKGVIADLISNGIMKLITGVKDFAVESVKVGADFDSSMAEVAAISGASGEELEKLRDTAKEYGKSTTFSASESADALKYMALAGWDANKSISALPGILDLAAASGMELGSASDMVTDYLTAFGMEASKATDFADMLAYAQSNSNTTAEMLGEAYKNSAASLNAAGQDVYTVTALLSKMADQGLKGSEAGTALNAIMRDMTAKMENGAIAIGDTSVAVTDSSGNFRDLTDILKDVEKATDGMADGQRAAALSAVFGDESLKGLNLTLNAGVGEAEKFEDALRKSSGAAGKMADTMNDNLNGDLKNLSSKLEGIRIELYEKFQPVLRKSVEILSSMLTKIGAVANKIVGWATSEKVVNKLKSAFITAKNAVTPIVDAVGNVISKIAEFVTSEATINTVKNAFEKLKAIIEPIISIVKRVVGEIITIATSKPVVDGVKKAFDGMKKVISKIYDVAKKVFDFLSENMETLLPLVEGLTIAFVAYKTVMLAINSAAKIYATTQAIVNAVMNASPVMWIVTAIGLLIGVIILLIKNWDSVKQTALNVWNGIKAVWNTVATWFNNTVIQPLVGFFTGLWTNITTIFSGVGEFFSIVFTNAVNGIQTAFSVVAGFFSGVWNGIVGIFSAVGSWFGEKFTAAVEGIKTAFSTVVGFFTGIWNNIKSIFTKIGTTIGNGIAQAFATVVNAIINFAENTINGFIRAINSAIGLINKIPGVSISTISELSIPRLAKGGIVDKPTIAQIGEDGKEAIVPLENNLEWIKKVVSGVVSAIRMPSNSTESYDNSTSTTTSNEYNEYNEYKPTFVLNMNGASATDDNKRKVKGWIKEAFSEVFDDLDKDNPPVIEV